MHLGKDLQLEKLIDEAIKRSTFKLLEELQEESDEIVTCRCSKQMINKLNKLILRELNKKEIKNTTLLFHSIHKYGKHMTIQGEDGLAAMIKQGLVQKARKIWTTGGKEKKESLINFAEDFFDALMAIFNTSKEGRCQVLDAFLHRTGSIVTDDGVNIYIQEEAIKKMNTMLNQMTREDRKRLLLTTKMQLLMNDFGKRILDAGDYNLQVAITESLCRMTSETQRQEMADEWFYMEFVADAFKRIKDSAFETDCRRFLNQVNGTLGERTSVYTFPCLEAFLNKHELKMPSDDKLEEFWIDFNVGSQSISFYVITEEDDEEPMWETVCLPEEDVESYSVEVKDEKRLLAVDMNTLFRIGNIEGNQIQIFFDLTLDIFNTVQKVYGSTKFKGLPMKDRISEVKTAVHVIFDGNSSQVLVAESQLSSPDIKGPKNGKVSHTKTVSITGSGMDPQQTSISPPKTLAPRKQRTSEVAMFVTSTERPETKTACTPTIVNSTPARKNKVKPPLEMKNSSGRKSTFNIKMQNVELGNSIYPAPSGESMNKLSEESSLKKITANRVVEILQEQDDESSVSQKAPLDRTDDIVPDSQLVMLKEKPLLPGLLEITQKNKKSLSKKKCWVSDSPASSCSTLERQTSCMKYTFQQDERIIKHQTFCSIFDEKSPGQGQCNKTQTLEQQQPDKAAKLTPAENQTKTATHINDSMKRINHTFDRRLLPSSSKNDFSKTQGLSLDSTEKMSSICSIRKLGVSGRKFDEVCHNTGSKEQNNPQRGDCSKRHNMDLTCKSRLSDERKYSIRKESTITETMISAIAAKYTNEKKKTLNKGLDLLNRSECDESQFLGKMQRKKLKEEKGTPKEHKGGSTNKSLNRKIEDSTTDVYRFVGSSDEPTITLGMKYEPVLQQYCANKRETVKKKMKNGLTEKVEHKASRCRKKKYFFTDNDTDGKTDVSWLRESNRKIKPKLVAYTRQKKQNLAESSGKGKVATLQRKHYEKRSKSTKRIEATNSVKVQDGRKKRTCPRRSTAARPCYKEVSASEFDNSEESLSFSPQSERNLTTPPQVKNIFNNIKREANMSMKHCEVSAVSSIHSFTNTSSIEKMRYERPCEPMASTRTTSPLESESSIQSKSLPEPLQTSCLSMETITKKNFQDPATPLLSPIRSATKSAFISDFSPIVSSVSMPEVTPICLQSCEVNENDEEVQQEFVTLKKNNDCTTMKKSCSSESSVITARSSSNFTIKTVSSKRTTAEETLSTSALLEEGRREMDKVIESEVHKSGPSNHASVFKRIYGEDHQSNFHVFEEDGGAKDEGTGLRPRKLFKCDLENQSINRDAEFQICITSDHASVDNWELNAPNMGTICQQFRKELQKKFQKHSQRIDTFTKFSLKSAQQRMSSTSLQIHSYRLQRLNKLQTIFTQELERFEKDSQSLKMMEKELTNFWKNHSQAFSELKENEEQRIQHLKSSFENNLCHSVDFEEQIFSNEMHLMRKDMKTVQERLLKEMQEEELVTVRRGLQSFFQSETMRF